MAPAKDKDKARKPDEEERRTGWFGFGRKKVKEAHLGEENKMYYNEELKRWVERGKEDEYRAEAGPSAPPVVPAPQAQTSAPADGAAPPVANQQPPVAPQAAGSSTRRRGFGYAATPGISVSQSSSTNSFGGLLPQAPAANNFVPQPMNAVVGVAFFNPGAVQQTQQPAQPLWANANAAPAGNGDEQNNVGAGGHGDAAELGNGHDQDAAANGHAEAGGADVADGEAQGIPEAADAAQVPDEQPHPSHAATAHTLSNGYHAPAAAASSSNGYHASAGPSHAPATTSYPQAPSSQVPDPRVNQLQGRQFHSASEPALPPMHVPADGAAAAFLNSMHPNRPGKMDGPLPWELPPHLRYGEDPVGLCSRWNQLSGDGSYHPDMLNAIRSNQVSPTSMPPPAQDQGAGSSQAAQPANRHAHHAQPTPHSQLPAGPSSVAFSLTSTTHVQYFESQPAAADAAALAHPTHPTGSAAGAAPGPSYHSAAAHQSDSGLTVPAEPAAAGSSSQQNGSLLQSTSASQQASALTAQADALADKAMEDAQQEMQLGAQQYPSLGAWVPGNPGWVGPSQAQPAQHAALGGPTHAAALGWSAGGAQGSASGIDAQPPAPAHPEVIGQPQSTGQLDAHVHPVMDAGSEQAGAFDAEGGMVQPEADDNDEGMGDVEGEAAPLAGEGGVDADMAQEPAAPGQAEAGHAEAGGAEAGEGAGDGPVAVDHPQYAAYQHFMQDALQLEQVLSHVRVGWPLESHHVYGDASVFQLLNNLYTSFSQYLAYEQQGGGVYNPADYGGPSNGAPVAEPEQPAAAEAAAAAAAAEPAQPAQADTAAAAAAEPTVSMAEHEAALEQLRAELTAAHEAQLAAQSSAHEEEMRKLAAAQEALMAQLQAEHEAAIGVLVAKHDALEAKLLAASEAAEAKGETGEAQIGSGHSSDDSKSSEGSEQDMEEALREQVADMGQELIYYTSALAELEDRYNALVAGLWSMNVDPKKFLPSDDQEGGDTEGSGLEGGAGGSGMSVGTEEDTSACTCAPDVGV